MIDESKFYFNRNKFKWENKIITIARLSEEKNLIKSLIAFKEFTKNVKEKCVEVIKMKWVAC